MSMCKAERKKVEVSERACNQCQLKTKKLKKAEKVANCTIVFGARPSSPRGSSKRFTDKSESIQSSTTRRKSWRNTSF